MLCLQPDWSVNCWEDSSLKTRHPQTESGASKQFSVTGIAAQVWIDSLERGGGDTEGPGTLAETDLRNRQ